MSFGGGGSSQTSKPLTGAERSEIYQAGMGNISGSMKDNTLNMPGYNAPSFASAATPLSMSPGDYQAMQKSLLEGGTAGLDYAKQKDLERFNESAAKRGIWSSGLAEQGETDIKTGYAPQYAAAGATAAGQAAGLQSQQNQSLNTLAAQEAAARNAFAQSNAQNLYQSQWQPLNYLKDIYNQSGGTISSGSSMQGSLSI